MRGRNRTIPLVAIATLSLAALVAGLSSSEGRTAAVRPAAALSVTMGPVATLVPNGGEPLTTADVDLFTEAAEAQYRADVAAYLAGVQAKIDADNAAAAAAAAAQAAADAAARAARTPAPAVPAPTSSRTSAGHSDAWWWGVAICEQGGRNDPYFGYFSFMDGSQGGKPWAAQVAAANALLAAAGHEVGPWAAACVQAGYNASPSG